MIDDVSLFVGLAEIAGVFVGFGALIGFTRRGSVSYADRVQVRGVVLAGLVALATALFPVALSRYTMDPSLVWRISSGAFLLLTWALFLLPLWRDAEARSEARSYANADRASLMVLGSLEVLVQGVLLLVVLGFFVDTSAALYLSALVVNLLQAAFMLCRLVLAPSGDLQ